MPGIAGSYRKASSARNAPKRGFAPPPTVGATADFMQGSLAANAGGVMKPDLPVSAFKQRRVEMAEEEKGSVALRTVTYPVFGASTEASYASEDGSSFTVSTQDAPMHIPGSATGLTASLVNASVPYVWDNLKQDQVVTVEGTFPRRVTLADDTTVSYTIRQPSSTTFEAAEGTLPTGDEVSAYLVQSQSEGFWFRPNMVNAYLDGTTETMGEDGKFDDSTKWFDLTTSSSATARNTKRVRKTFTYTGSQNNLPGVGGTDGLFPTENPEAVGGLNYPRRVQDRVYQDLNSNTIEVYVGKIIAVDRSEPVTFTIEYDENVDGTPVDTMKMFLGFTDQGSSTGTVGGNVVPTGGYVELNANQLTLSSTISLPAKGVKLSGDMRTGTPMLRFGQDITDPTGTAGADGSTIKTFSPTLSLDQSALNSLRAMRSEYDYYNNSVGGISSGIINIPLKFNQPLLDRMEFIRSQFTDAATLAYNQSIYSNEVKFRRYSDSINVAAIKLCSFDIIPTFSTGETEIPVNDSVTISFFLRPDPKRTGTDKVWALTGTITAPYEDEFAGHADWEGNKDDTVIAQEKGVAAAIDSSGTRTHSGATLLTGTSPQLTGGTGTYFGLVSLEASSTYPQLIETANGSLPMMSIVGRREKDSSNFKEIITFTCTISDSENGNLVNATCPVQITIPTTIANDNNATGGAFETKNKNKNAWEALRARNFRIGSSFHKINILNNDDAVGAGNELHVHPAPGWVIPTPAPVYDFGNFSPNAYLSKQNTSNLANAVQVWPEDVMETAAFFVGDIFTHDISSHSTLTESTFPTSTTSMPADALFVYEDALLQQFTARNASPFVQLPSLDARSPQEYTSVVSHTKSFKIPAGEYDTVQDYLDKVNEVFAQSTEFHTGISDLASLDIEYDGMNAGDVDYDLLVHYNRPIDGGENPLLTATQATSGLEPLLNQRFNVNMKNLQSDSGTANTVFTRIKETNVKTGNENLDNYALIYSDSDLESENMKLLLLHKPSLTVEVIEVPEPASVGGIVAKKFIDFDVFVPISSAGAPVMITGLRVIDAGGHINFQFMVWSPREGWIQDDARQLVQNNGGSIGTASGEYPLNQIHGKLMACSVGPHTGTSQNPVVACISLNKITAGAANESTNVIVSRKIIFDSDGNVVDKSNIDTHIAMNYGISTGNAFAAKDDYGVLDFEIFGNQAVASVNGATPGNIAEFRMFILMRKTDATASSAYTAVGVKINENGTQSNETIPSDILNLIEDSAAVYGTDMGVDASYGITDYIKAAQMPKIGMKKRFAIAAPDDLFSINIPHNTDAGVVAFMARRIQNGYQLKYSTLALSSIDHDRVDGFCTRVLFTNSNLKSAVTDSKNQLSLIMSKGYVHQYFYGSTNGIIDGSSSTKTQDHGNTDALTHPVGTTTESLWFQFHDQTDIGTAVNALATRVQDGLGSNDEIHLLIVGDLSKHSDGSLADELIEDGLIHRTSVNEAQNADAIKYYTDQKLPVLLSFNPQAIMESVWTSAEDDYFASNPYTNFTQDFIQSGVHNSQSFDMFEPSTSGDPLTSLLAATNITVPKGNYTFESLGRALNELMHDIDVNPDSVVNHRAFSLNTIQFENSPALRKLYFTSKLSSSFEDDLPSKIKLSWATGTAFATLFEGATTVLLEANSPQPRDYSEGISYVATGLTSVRTVYVKANFVQGGINPQRQKSQILASIPVDREPGQTLVARPAIPLKVSAQNFLNQDTQADLEFTITDEKGEPLSIGLSHPWSVNVLIEWEQDINLARLRQSGSETRYR